MFFLIVYYSFSCLDNKYLLLPHYPVTIYSRLIQYSNHINNMFKKLKQLKFKYLIAT